MESNQPPTPLEEKLRGELREANREIRDLETELDETQSRVSTLEEELEDAARPKDIIDRWCKMRSGYVRTSSGACPWCAWFVVDGLTYTGAGQDALDAIMAAEENYHWSKK